MQPHRLAALVALLLTASCRESESGDPVVEDRAAAKAETIPLLVHGRVVDANGAPVAGLRLSARQRRSIEPDSGPLDPDRLQAFLEGAEHLDGADDPDRFVGVTDADGTFRIEGEDSGHAISLRADPDWVEIVGLFEWTGATLQSGRFLFQPSPVTVQVRELPYGQLALRLESVVPTVSELPEGAQLWVVVAHAVHHPPGPPREWLVSRAREVGTVGDPIEWSGVTPFPFPSPFSSHPEWGMEDGPAGSGRSRATWARFTDLSERRVSTLLDPGRYVVTVGLAAAGQWASVPIAIVEDVLVEEGTQTEDLRLLPLEVDVRTRSVTWAVQGTENCAPGYPIVEVRSWPGGDASDWTGVVPYHDGTVALTLPRARADARVWTGPEESFVLEDLPDAHTIAIPDDR